MLQETTDKIFEIFLKYLDDENMSDEDLKKEIKNIIADCLGSCVLVHLVRDD